MQIRIGEKNIGEDGKVFIIAEMSANHNNNFDIAVETMKAMKKAGADAVKFQTYTPDTITIDCDNEYFQIKHGTVWDGRTAYDLYKEAYTPWEWFPELQKIAKSIGLEFFSSVFDRSSVDFMEKLAVPAYKIASFEITDIPLIEYTASMGKPVIISTGIASLTDIEAAVNACKRKNNEKIILLKCTTAYPAPLAEANLKTIPNLAETFSVISGLSDHTIGATSAIAAVALGAKVLEKHFILDKSNGGPDSSFSMEPDDFAKMVQAVRETEQALGGVSYRLTEKMRIARTFSRSLFVVENIRKGEIFSAKNIRSIRPGQGLSPVLIDEIIGKRAAKDIVRGTPLAWNLIDS